MINTKAIRCRMIDFDLTVAELADKVDVSPSYLSGVISGKKTLTFGMAEKLQEALEIDNDSFGHYFLSGGETR